MFATSFCKYFSGLVNPSASGIMEGMQPSPFYSPPAAMMGPAAPVGTPAAQQGYYQTPFAGQAVPVGPTASMTTNAPKGTFNGSVGVPTNDDELRSLLARFGPQVQELTGRAQTDLGDSIYSAVSAYAQSNPNSAMAARVLESAHKLAPQGHSFPKGPSNPTTNMPRQQIA